MDVQEQTILWSRVPDLLIRQGDKTGLSRDRRRLSVDQIAEWKNFEEEVRSRTASPSSRLFASPEWKHTSLLLKQARNLGSLNICSEINQVFTAQGVKPRFADRSTGIHALAGHDPDIIVQGSLQDGATRVVGEVKTPWTTLLRDKSTISGLRAYGQISRYMDQYGCRYGFISIYNETVILRRVSQFRFQLSPVIEHSKVSQRFPTIVSLREALYFVAKTASRSQWKYHGTKVGRALVQGDWKMSMNLRN